MRILLIDNYDSFTYNIVELLRQFEAVDLTIVKNDNLAEVAINEFDKMIVSPGPDLPNAAGHLMQFLSRSIGQLPILGICLGHQAIAEYFGAELVQYDDPRHGEKTTLEVKEQNILFKGLPDEFEVGLYHSWYVSKNNFPPDLVITAQNKEGVIMAVAHKTLKVYSVQFHPESYMSAYGKEILQNFICSS